MFSSKNLFLLLFFGFLSSVSSVLLEVEPYEPITMGSIENLILRIRFDPRDEKEEYEWTNDKFVRLTFNLTNEESWAIKVVNESMDFNYKDIRKGTPKILSLEGTIIGFDNLQIFAEIRSFDATDFIEGEKKLLKETEVFVVLRDRALNMIFTGVMSIMIIVNTINMGAQLDLHIIKDVFKKPIGPAVGFASQFIFMPLFSFGIGWLLFDDLLFRLGLFVLGCCPGGTGSNFWCLLLNGDLNLSITMTFISTIAALGMMPLWLFLLGPYLTEGELVIPYDQLIFTLILLVAPVTLGMWIRHRWPKAGQVMAKIIVPFTIVTVLFIFTAGIYINLFIFLLMTATMVIAGFLVAGSGYFFGAFLAWLCRLNMSQITAVSIETAFQNGGIAFILLRLSLPEPFGDLASVAPVAQLMITGSPLWLIYFALKIYQKFFKKETPEEICNLPRVKTIDDGTPMPEIRPLVTITGMVDAKEDVV